MSILTFCKLIIEPYMSIFKSDNDLSNHSLTLLEVLIESQKLQRFDWITEITTFWLNHSFWLNHRNYNVSIESQFLIESQKLQRFDWITVFDWITEITTFWLNHSFWFLIESQKLQLFDWITEISTLWLNHRNDNVSIESQKLQRFDWITEITTLWSLNHRKFLWLNHSNISSLVRAFGNPTIYCL